jgi:hypothetical protein
MSLEVQAKVEQRFVEDFLLYKEQSNYQTAQTPVAVQRRMDRFELHMQQAKDICNHETYRAALAGMSVLIDIDPTAPSPGAEKLRALGTLVQTYEASSFPILRGPN